MPGQNQSINTHAHDVETPLDDLIRASLFGETRRRVGDPDKLWAQMLQRAQTEVAQLPPLTKTGAENDLALLSEASVELQADNRPTALSLTGGDGDVSQALTPNLADQISLYKHAMEMKMWRTVGSLGLSFGTV
jgi:hypothetical protein